MKKIVLLVLLIPFFSCEEAIDVELQSDDPRLVVDALIGYNENNGNPLILDQVPLTLAAPFLSTEVAATENALVYLYYQ